MRAVAGHGEHVVRASSSSCWCAPGAAAALAFSAAPAAAFDGWAHDGASPMRATVTTASRSPTPPAPRSATAAATRASRQTVLVVPRPRRGHERRCPRRARPAARAAICGPAVHDYTTPFTHGLAPHDGAAGYGKTCLDCHPTSISIVDPGGSPHHDGVDDAAADLRELSRRRRRRAPRRRTTATRARLPRRHEHPAGAGHVQPVPSGHDLRHARLPRVPRRPGAQHRPAGAGLLRLPRRRLPEARRQGRLPHLPHRHRRLPPRAVRRPPPKDLPVLPRHEARRQEGRRSKCATCHKGTGTGPAAKAQHSTTVTKRGRLLGVPLAEAARQRSRLRHHELPHVPQEQVPRRAEVAAVTACAPAATGAPPGTPTGTAAVSATEARSTPRDRPSRGSAADA